MYCFPAQSLEKQRFLIQKNTLKNGSFRTVNPCVVGSSPTGGAKEVPGILYEYRVSSNFLPALKRKLHPKFPLELTYTSVY